jgi:hypothetical protein
MNRIKPAASNDADRAPEFRGRIYDSIVETIGATPLVRLAAFARDAGVEAEILGKCEFFNPLSSVKDRIGVAMIEALAAAGSARRRCSWSPPAATPASRSPSPPPPRATASSSPCRRACRSSAARC